MRSLFAVLPGSGHLLAMLPLARALVAAGHEVVFASSEPYAAEVERHGFRCLSAGRPWLISSIAEHFPDLAALRGEERAAFVYRNCFANRVGAEFAAGLVSLQDRLRFDLVVFDSPNYGAAAAAEALGLPHACVAVSSISTDQRWVRRFEPELEVVRASLRLPPDPGAGMPFRHLVLSSVPAFLYGDADLPPTLREVRMDSYEAAGALPAWLQSLPPRPTVYATLGTVQNKRPALFRAIAEGLSAEDVNVVLTTGNDQDPSGLGPLPANARAERFIPQNLLIPRCAAVLSHGGSGTLRASLWFGVPQVLFPFSADQPRNAEICAGLGLAAVVDPATASPASIRRAVLEVLRAPSFQERARDAGVRMRAMPEVGEAVRLVESLAAPVR